MSSDFCLWVLAGSGWIAFLFTACAVFFIGGENRGTSRDRKRRGQ